jgi:hypothetical protein
MHGSNSSAPGSGSLRLSCPLLLLLLPSCHCWSGMNVTCALAPPSSISALKALLLLRCLGSLRLRMLRAAACRTQHMDFVNCI